MSTVCSRSLSSHSSSVAPSGKASASSSFAFRIFSRLPRCSMRETPDIGDDTHHRLCRVAQVLDLILGAHAHFHHRYLSFGGNAHQRFGRADYSLFWLPSVLMMRKEEAITAATISLVVVLPTLPVMPITWAGILARYSAEIFQERPQTALYPQYLLCWGVVAVMLGHRRCRPLPPPAPG